jgi:hypothetical protein
MKIEVGKRYRTRDGRVATVERIDRDKEPDNAAAMSADVDGKVLFYCANGRYYSGSTNHDFDLVEELPDEQTGGPLPDLDVTELSPGAAPVSEGVQEFREARVEAPVVDKSLKVNVGASRESVAEARGAINDILSARVDNSTMVEALRALTSVCKVENVSISGSHFSTGG